MKKNSLFFLIFFVTAVIVSSCKKEGFLDQTVTTSLNDSTTFTDSVNAMAFLNNIYLNIGFASDPRRFGGAGLDAACDEAEGPNTSASNGFVQFATGSVNPNIVSDDAWRIPYANIRAVNQFLKNLPKVPFSNALKNEVKGEARFLRAWYYAIMLEHYGGVPIIGDTLYAFTDVIPAKRNSFRECVNYILSECDAAAASLPTTQIGADYGRVSRGACLALKARVLLYAASPLFNNGGIGKGTGNGLDSITAYPDADPNRWKLAADAARAVIGTQAYELYMDNSTPGIGFQKLFTLRYNSEYILARMMDGNRYLESLWQPPSRGGGGGPYPYQEMVDAFEMKNGKAITDPASGYDPAFPYKNRDPRLDFSILHDSSLLVVFLSNQPAPLKLYWTVNPYEPASGDAVKRGTITGYYINKMLDPNVAAASVGGTNRVLPLIRYAEVLLNFAEAENEYLSSPSAEVYQAVESIRQRAGLNPYTLPAGLSKDQMREVIHHERRVELAYEGHRFFDVRRWMIADQTENKLMRGLEVDRGGGTVTYKIFDVRKHNFSKAMYLWPFPQAEIAKSPDLTQNPLW